MSRRSTALFMTGKGKLAKRRSRSGASRRKANTAREHAQVPTAVIETSDTEESSTKPSDEIRHSSSHDITADQRTSPKQHGKPRLSEVSTGATRTQSPLRPVITLVNGEYIEHIPGGLPEPLSTGFKAWATAQRMPQQPTSVKWNNRLLQYWRLATDFGRFKDVDASSSAARKNGHRHGLDHRASQGEYSAESPLRPQSSPQRPYTAPAHHWE